MPFCAPSPIVLDDTPYAFVKPENRFFSPEDSSGHQHFFGHGAAPDNATEFGQFVEAMVCHLVSRYGHAPPRLDVALPSRNRVQQQQIRTAVGWRRRERCRRAADRGRHAEELFARP